MNHLLEGGEVARRDRLDIAPEETPASTQAFLTPVATDCACAADPTASAEVDSRARPAPERLLPQQIGGRAVLHKHGLKDGGTDLDGQLLVALRLLETGLAHIGAHDDLEILRREPRRKLGQEPIERLAAQRLEHHVLGRHLDVDRVHGELEVHGAGRVARLQLGRATLHEQPHEQPARGAKERADRRRDQLIEAHRRSIGLLERQCATQDSLHKAGELIARLRGRWQGDGHDQLAGTNQDRAEARVDVGVNQAGVDARHVGRGGWRQRLGDGRVRRLCLADARAVEDVQLQAAGRLRTTRCRCSRPIRCSVRRRLSAAPGRRSGRPPSSRQPRAARTAGRMRAGRTARRWQLGWATGLAATGDQGERQHQSGKA